MNFSLTPEQLKLKKEFEQFFQDAMKDAPPGWASGGLESIYATDENWAFHRKMARKLGEKGWLVRNWPKEYGGHNASPMDQLVFNEVAGYYKSPGIDPQGTRMIGQMILLMGTEDQKQEHLPPIARGEIMWCQGWSEPNAGSDLASLTARGYREKDYYVVNGQKTWTSGAHRAEWIYVLVRTDPSSRRSRGLTLLLAPMDTPGITVRPIINIDGAHTFNEVFFEDVRIPARNVLGEENKGWDVIRKTMNLERFSMLKLAEARRTLEELIDFCKEAGIRGTPPLINDPVVRQKLAQLVVEVEVGFAMAYSIGHLQEKGEFFSSMAPSSAAKVYISELWQRLAYMGCQIMGLYGQVKKGSKWAPLYGNFEQYYQICMGNKMAGGTVEIQRNLIAWTGLDLPRI